MEIIYAIAAISWAAYHGYRLYVLHREAKHAHDCRMKRCMVKTQYRGYDPIDQSPMC